jgi:hypothetical protein
MSKCSTKRMNIAEDQDQSEKLNYTIITKPVYGEISSFDPSSGGGIYSPFLPTANRSLDATISVIGRDTFGFKVTDSDGRVSNPATVTVTSMRPKCQLLIFVDSMRDI